MKLYKYYPPESESFILLKNGDISLRFSQPSALNDPFDLSPTIDIDKKTSHDLAEIIQEKTKSKSMYFLDTNTGEPYERATLKQFGDSLYEKTVKIKKLREHNDLSIGVLSLSKNKKSTLMWSHYSKNHTGFMLEIENSFELKNSNTQLKAQDVDYSKYRPTTKQSESYSDKSYFIYKDPVWHYEEEMRLVVELHTLEPTEKTRNDPLPCYCYTYPRSQLGRIILGAMCPKDVEERIRKWADKHAPKIKVKKAYLNPANYEINYK